MDQPTDNRTKAEEDFRLQTSDFILQTSDFRLFFFKVVGSRKSEVCCLKSLLGFRTINTWVFFSINIYDLADKTRHSSIRI